MKYWLMNLRDDLALKIRLATLPHILRLVGLYVCDTCGVVSAKGGCSVRVEDGSRSPYVRRVDGEPIGYSCERCWNVGHLAEDLKRVKEEFGRLA